MTDQATERRLFKRVNASEQETERGTEQRLTLPEAAEILGTTVDAVRMRARRGTMRSDKGEDGRVYVYLNPDEAEPHGDGTAAKSDVQVEGYAELVEDLRDQVGYLRDQLSTRDEELRRKDHLLAALVQRVPELEAAPQEPPCTRETASEDRDGYEAPGRRAGPEAASHEPERGFWSRLFGG